MSRTRRFLVAVAWLALALLVGVGGAGVATALNHQPSTGSRPELTWRGDAAAAPALETAAGRLQELSDAVDALGSTAKTALAMLVAGDTTTLAATLDTGTEQIAAVSTAVAALEAAISAVPGQGEDAALALSSRTINRYQLLAGTPELAANLEADWALLSARASAAAVVPSLLARHDEQAAAAAAQGEAGHYAQALALLDAPAATIAQLRRAAEGLAKNADVSTLTQWIDRQAAYDASLEGLYRAMLGSNGKVTPAVKAAFAAEEAAKAALPTTNRGIVVIMGDLAHGGPSQAVIDIEVVRGSLAAAIADEQAAATASAPVPARGPSPSPAAASASASSAVPASPGRSAGATPPP